MVQFAWCFTTLQALSALLPAWSKLTDNIYRDCCKWAFTPLPRANGVVAFKDCVLKFENGVRAQLRRVDIDPTELDCYKYIPESLAYKPSDDFQAWFRQYFTTTIAGDMDAMEIEFSVETLAMFGLRLPHHCIVYFGPGGNSKGARSRLRARCFATGHKWISPGVFDKALKDEFRKQGFEFYGASMATLREADKFDFDEKCFRA